MKNEVEQIALQNDMSIEFVTWFFNEKKAGCGNVWFMMMAAMWEGWKGRSIEMDKLAAENVALKESRNNLAEFIHEELDADYPLNMNLETHATDRFVAGIKADGVEMFVEKCREKSKQAISSDIRNNWWLAGEHADDFAKQLREGADK
ncbi:hypothetical protein ACRRUL_003562 [Klebsiella pneumoniae]|uniref:hypothetical protein n=1 Tax=Klebsiella pneumoniae TaxID=573 RepID=UPI0009CE7A06|nr:hypothetical protein [Klebsiella pneumoniae]EKJ7349161.1 hypothetical protein [Klebsiella pneumoniae]EKJ7749208.1 hypothetical protein [Klebsiella pneumoniae]EKV4519004.1 hypothetical protein [Klebsiella pneumoniae]EKW0310464.1 hypothetical protein [Klebsiella pneumoniae]EKW6109177.1 hypothetical protein [Klebsiella pneumoniae]